MSIHSSLRPSKGQTHKSVFTRLERIKILFENNKWKESDSIFGLPKVKSVKVKIKKEKSAEAKKTAETAAAPAAAATSAKPQGAPAKK
ncbi:MAG: small basic protein [Candidatus Omnitrophota bacterium]